jgi:hypothetical protein
MTFLYKRVVPIFLFGLFGCLILAVPWLAPDRGPALALAFVALALFGVHEFFLMKLLVFGLVDEVLDDGDAVVVRNRDMEERIALSNIVNVSRSLLVSPPRVTLLLRNPSVFGERVSFCRPTHFNPFSSSPIDDLIRRVDEQRHAMRDSK